MRSAGWKGRAPGRAHRCGRPCRRRHHVAGDGSRHLLVWPGSRRGHGTGHEVGLPGRASACAVPTRRAPVRGEAAGCGARRDVGRACARLPILVDRRPGGNGASGSRPPQLDDPESARSPGCAEVSARPRHTGIGSHRHRATDRRPPVSTPEAVISSRRGLVPAGAVVRGASHSVPACSPGRRSGCLRRAVRRSPPAARPLISERCRVRAAPGVLVVRVRRRDAGRLWRDRTSTVGERGRVAGHAGRDRAGGRGSESAGPA